MVSFPPVSPPRPYTPPLLTHTRHMPSPSGAYVSKREHGARGDSSEDRTLLLGLLRPQVMGTEGHRHTQELNISQTESLFQVQRNIIFSEGSHTLRLFVISAQHQKHGYNPDSEETYEAI